MLDAPYFLFSSSSSSFHWYLSAAQLFLFASVNIIYSARSLSRYNSHSCYLLNFSMYTHNFVQYKTFPLQCIDPNVMSMALRSLKQSNLGEWMERHQRHTQPPIERAFANICLSHAEPLDILILSFRKLFLHATFFSSLFYSLHLSATKHGDFLNAPWMYIYKSLSFYLKNYSLVFFSVFVCVFFFFSPRGNLDQPESWILFTKILW